MPGSCDKQKKMFHSYALSQMTATLKPNHNAAGPTLLRVNPTSLRLNLQQRPCGVLFKTLVLSGKNRHVDGSPGAPRLEIRWQHADWEPPTTHNVDLRQHADLAPAALQLHRQSHFFLLSAY